MPPRRAPATRNVPPVPVSPAAVRPPVVAASKPAAAPMPPREAMPHEATPIAAVRAALRADLRQTRSLQHAFLLSEILGPPRALRAIRCGGVACPVSPGTARPRLARSPETGILNSKTRRKP
jgi:hypothetical protein